MHLRPLAAAVLLVVSLLALRAEAGPAEDRAAADALFREGRALVKQGRHAEACPKLAAAQQLDPTAGTLLALGDCYELNGQTASAWTAFQSGEMMARQSNNTPAAEEAARRAGLLEPKLSKLIVEIAPATLQACTCKGGEHCPEIPADDHNPCTVDLCVDGETIHEPLADGSVCGNTSEGPGSGTPGAEGRAQEAKAQTLQRGWCIP